MRRLAAVVMMAMLSSGTLRAQDSDILQSILSELRSMHNDVRLGQTTQILLTELELQQTQVNRAMQKRDDARNRLTQVQDNQKNMVTQIARFNDNVDSITDPQQKKNMAQTLDMFKQQLANFKTQEQDRSNEVQETESALHKEQDTLEGIQEQLNAVVKKLQPATNP
jgi:chromosome segregation ATPase